jgi:hypothetical protein
VNAYRIGWLAVALSLGAVGLGAALVLFQAALLVLVSLFATGVLVALLSVTDSEAAAPWRRTRRVCGVALLGSAAVGALAGFTALVGPRSLLVAGLLAAGSPRALRAYRRPLVSLLRPTPAHLDALARSLAHTNPAYVPVELPLDPRLLTDDQLREAWRESQTAVRSSATNPLLSTRVVAERGRYLDELERRQPGLLRAWLASDPGAPDSPLSDAAATWREPSTIDWDELTGGQANDR